jgi:hypothetical protein
VLAISAALTMLKNVCNHRLRCGGIGTTSRKIARIDIAP